ncbi:MAG: hypothetical protein QXR19_17775 [Candidatus Jordarchaeaceae archaeon]
MNESISEDLEIKYLEESLIRLYSELALNMEEILMKLSRIWINLLLLEKRLEKIERDYLNILEANTHSTSVSQ